MIEKIYRKTKGISRPLLFSAPPASGKTAFLIEHVRTVLKKGVAPDTVLYFTNTERMASLAEEAICSSIDKGYTELWINNFASFGKKILRKEYAHLSDRLHANFEVITDFEKKLILRDILSKRSFETGYFSSVRSCDGFLGEAMDFIDRAKMNEKPPEVFRGTPKLEELGRIMKEYEDILKKFNLVDFHDLVLLCTKLFMKVPSLLTEYRKRFLWVIVDEFEDISKINYQLFRLIAKGKKNIIVASNPRESIYRFRGAEPDVVYSLLKKDFNPEFLTWEASRSVNKIRGVSLKTRTQEAEFVANEIARLVRDDPGGPKWKDFAIVMRGVNEDVNIMTNALRARSIPYSVMGGIGFFKQPDISTIISILMVLAGAEEDDFDETHLVHSLSNQFHSVLKEVELERLVIYAQRNRLKLLKLIKFVTERKLDLVSEESSVGLSAFMKKYNELRKRAAKVSVTRLIYDVMVEFKVLEKSLDTEGFPNLSRNIGYFTSIVEKYQKMGNRLTGEKLDFLGFMEHLNGMLQGYGKDMDILHVPGQDTVRIMTVQQAKGEFFRYVFITGLIEGEFPREFSVPALFRIEEWRTMGLYPPPDPAETYEEEKRMFSVAMGRGIECVYLTTYVQTGSGLEVMPSPFLRNSVSEVELFKSDILDIKDLRYFCLKNPEHKAAFKLLEKYDADAARGISEILNKKALPYAELFDRVHIKEGFVVSATAINTYIDCPAKFFYERILKFYIQPSSMSVFGTVIHGILKEFHDEFREQEQLLTGDPEQKIEHILKERWEKSGIAFATVFEKNSFFRAARKLIRDYIEEQKACEKWAVRHLEYSLDKVFDGFIIKGRIDRVDSLDAAEEIIDYKTTFSEFYMEKAIITRISKKEDFQLPIYYMLYHPVVSKKTMRLSLYWLAKFKGKKKATLDLSLDENKKLFSDSRNDLSDILRKIKGGMFSPVRDKCWQCRYSMLCDEE